MWSVWKPLFGGGGALSWIWLPVTTSLAPHYSCTSPMDCISHHALHSHIPIHHYTNHTAVTNHSLALIVSPHLHLIHTHTHLSSTLTCTHREVLFLPRLTFLSVIHPASCYLCVWPRTARPWNSEPVPVTPTSAWCCLRLCPASDIPVFACRPLPVWFCLCLINLLLQMDPHAFDQSLQQQRWPIESLLQWNRSSGRILRTETAENFIVWIKHRCMFLQLYWTIFHELILFYVHKSPISKNLKYCSQ